MRVALIITYHDETAVWPFLRRSLAAQTRQPDHLVLGIDGEAVPTPDVTGLAALSVVRTPPMIADLYGYGPLVRRAVETAAAADCEWTIHLDADCLMHPRFCEGYYRLGAGALVWYSVRSAQGPRLSVQPGRFDRTVYVGPNTYAPLPGDGLDYGHLCADPAFGVRRPYGQRGQHPGGDASLHGCNWAAPTGLFLQHAWPNRAGRGTDADWAGLAVGGGVRFLPAPDDCCVCAHVGPETNGRGLREEDHGGWHWKPPPAPSIPAEILAPMRDSV